MATATSEHERQRVEHLVLGRPRPAPAVPTKPRGLSRQAWKIRKAELRAKGATLSPGIEEAVQLIEAFGGKRGTPETIARASGQHQGSLARLCRDGAINANQLAAAEEIRNTVESIRADVALPIASWETRVDSGFRADAVFFERLGGVRLEMAYSRWRWQVDGPIALLLDMIVEDEAYSRAAQRHRVSPKRAKALLIAALDLWWRIRGHVGALVDPATLAAAQSGMFA